MSDLYDTCVLPKGKRCIRVLEILPAVSRLSESEVQQSDTLSPILQIDFPRSVVHNPDHAPLRFRFKILDLTTKPDFAALSYVWSLPTATQPFIKYGNSTVSVTENCHAALMHLRKALGGFTIWVDAICINQAQEKDEEKSAQLLLMGDIYSDARTVYVWLGTGTPGTNRAMRYLNTEKLFKYFAINEHGRVMSRPWAAVWAIMKAHWTRDGYPSLSQKSKRTSTKTSVADIEELLSRPWIGRLWTYQEIVLAENPIVVCGDHHVPWLNFEKNIVPLVDTLFCPEVDSARSWKSLSLGREDFRAQDEHSVSSALTLTQYEAFIARVSQMHRRMVVVSQIVCTLYAGSAIVWVIIEGILWGLAKPYDYPEKEFKLPCLVLAATCPLSLLLLAFCIVSIRRGSPHQKLQRAPVEELASSLYVRKASEPKDMAFGVWAILQKKASDDVLPNIMYSHDLDHIYWTLSKELIRQTASIQSLYFAAARGIPGAPSWVPDWSAHNDHSWRSLNNNKNQVNLYGIPLLWGMEGFRSYLEDKTSTYFEFNERERVLTVRGRHIWTICRLSHLNFQKTKNTFQESEHDTHLENLRLMLKYASRERTPWTNLKFVLNFLNRAGIWQDDPWFQERVPEMLTWTRFCKRHSSKSPSTVLALLQSNESVLATQITICNILAHRGGSLYYSSQASNSSRGVCGRNAQIGDQVVRIVGLPHLLVLRTIAGEGNAVSIVSPAGVEVRNMAKGPSMARRLGLAGEDEDCIQYNIH